MSEAVLETDLAVGPRAIDAYSRLSYTMWYALAEFIDNSTQSRQNYGSIIDDVLKQEGRPLEVMITHNRLKKELEIEDNSIGMTLEKLVEALRIAHPTKDSTGRSKYGMGMKTAACWIGKKWKIVTCEWGSGDELTAEVDVAGIAHAAKKIPITRRKVPTSQHGTKIVVSELHRNIQKRTEETIRHYLGSMYRFDLANNRLKLVYNNEEILQPQDYPFDTDPHGKPMRRDLPPKLVGGKPVKGWVGVLREKTAGGTGGGRKFGGFSLFQNQRQIEGFPKAWKPSRIFGGVEDEGANNLIAQRLMGVIELDGFDVSHTKDAILFRDDEEEELIEFLYEQTKDYRDYSLKRRGSRGQPWSRDKVKDFVDSMKQEFTSPEMKDAVNTSMLPPLDTILSNNKQQVSSLTDDEKLATIEVVPSELRIIVSYKQVSEYEPHLTIATGAEPGTVHVIINGLHPYYIDLESSDAAQECVRQYIYDAIAEYRVSKQDARVNADSVRRLKNDLLRAQVVRIENAAAAVRESEFETTVSTK
jgi:hypothetical protein